MICKCGDNITESDISQTQQLRLAEINIPDHPRCKGCLSILFGSVIRLRKAGEKFSFNKRRK